MRTRRPDRSADAAQPGFTLVEVVAVVTIVALLSGATVLVFRQPYLAARQQRSVEYLQFVDKLARTRSPKTPGEVIFDVRQNTVQWIAHDDAGPRSGLRRTVLIDQVWTLREGRLSRQTARIRFRGDGTCQTYAIRTSASGVNPRWLFFSGVTGQHVELGGDDEAQSFFRDLIAARTDTR